jgi:hypothetical protein
LWPGVNVFIKKNIFAEKIGRKEWSLLTQRLQFAICVEKLSLHGFKKNAIFFSENWRKSPNILLILTSTPGQTFNINILKNRQCDFQATMIDFYSDLAPVDPRDLCQGELKSEVMNADDKKYHIDLKVKILSVAFSRILSIFNRMYSDDKHSINGTTGQKCCQYIAVTPC